MKVDKVLCEMISIDCDDNNFTFTIKKDDEAYIMAYIIDLLNRLEVPITGINIIKELISDSYWSLNQIENYIEEEITSERYRR